MAPFRRALRIWLGVEFGAGILALALFVAIGPLIAIALPRLFGEVLPFWALSAVVLSVSAPLAILLSASALRISAELAHPPRSVP